MLPPPLWWPSSAGTLSLIQDIFQYSSVKPTSTMNAIFHLFMMLVVFMAMVAVEAGVHHYKVPADEGHHNGGGSIFDDAASLANGILG